MPERKHTIIFAMTAFALFVSVGSWCDEDGKAKPAIAGDDFFMEVPNAPKSYSLSCEGPMVMDTEANTMHATKNVKYEDYESGLMLVCDDLLFVEEKKTGTASGAPVEFEWGKIRGKCGDIEFDLLNNIIVMKENPTLYLLDPGGFDTVLTGTAIKIHQMSSSESEIEIVGSSEVPAQMHRTDPNKSDKKSALSKENKRPRAPKTTIRKPEIDFGD